MLKFATTLLAGLSAAPMLAQIPCFDTNVGANLNLTDESFSAPLALGFSFAYGGSTYTDVQVCSNGYIVLGNGAPGNSDYTPTVSELVNNPIARICALWMDFDPAAAGSGGVHGNPVPAAGSTPAYYSITWNGVYRYNTTIAHTVQVRLVANGSIEVYMGGNTSANTGNWLHGASPGNGAPLNGVDFGVLPIVTAGSATLHQNGTGPVPFADAVFQWTPDGVGGYVVTAAPGCAARSTFGTGCVRGYTSFYEHFPISTQMDLSNTGMTGLFNGTSYTMLPAVTQFVPPSQNAVSLGLVDDGEATINLSAPLQYPGGSANVLFVCSNGFVSIGSNGTGYQPSPATFLNRVNASWNVWHDFICNASNNVLHEEIAGVVYLTWDQVLSYVGLAAGVTPSTFQMQFELATGNFHILFQNMDNVSVSGYTGGDGYLVGFSPSGPSANPGNIDLSTAIPATFPLFATDTTPLRMDATGRPVLGTSVSIDVSNIPAGTPFGAVLLGFTGYNPGVSLASIGMPGCFRYADGLATRLFVAPVGSASVLFAVPTAQAFVGTRVYCQGVSFSPPLTPLGAIASNGLLLEVGN